MSYTVHQQGKFKYIDEGTGETLLLLHGLFGALSNWEAVVEQFRGQFRVLIPVLPIYEMSIRTDSLENLTNFTEDFVSELSLTNLTLLGNSLGGHVALLYTLRHQANVHRLVLTGSSGLFENSMGGSYPRRGDYTFVSTKVAYTFYDPAVATKALIDEVFETTQSITKSLSIVAIAKSAQRNNLAKELHKITVPTLLIWGLNDTITPPHVAHEFNRLMPHSVLYFIDKCCHAPMMERPIEFNEALSDFLQKNATIAVEN